MNNQNLQKPTLAIDNTEIIKRNQEVIYEIEKQFNSENPIPLYKAYNLLSKESLTLQNKKKLSEIYGLSLSELKSSFASIERNERLASDLGCIPNNEYEFITALMKKWDVTMTFQKIYSLKTPYVFKDLKLLDEDLESYGDDVSVFIKAADPKTIPYDEMLPKVIKANAVLDMGYKRDEVTSALDDWTRTEQNIIIATAMKDITFNHTLNAEPEWNKLVDAITDINKEETKAVLKHFIWQIKRKMFKLPVKKHMMPVLTGLQEIGKSTIAKQLVSPIEDFTVITEFGSITDIRSHDLWKNYVLILDEMGNSTQANIEEIKQKITADSFSSRLMRTNNDTNIINHSTMIGTSNKDLSRLIFDDTGMRRFFQVTCKDSFDWNITNNIDYLMLWKSINEKKDSELITNVTLATSIRKTQNEKRFQSLIELFFRGRSYSIGTDEFVLADDLFKEFQNYEANHQPKNEMTSQKFFRDIIDIPQRIPELSIEKLKRTNKGFKYKLNLKQALSD